MFSGGLDSTILAAILCSVLDPQYQVDLVNVSFDARTSADRITAIFSFRELIRLFPERDRLQLICADYNISNVMDHERNFLRLLSPKTSHMDFNIGCALHFASKGEGFVFDTKFFDSIEFA
jgi:asparagine synthetase B (glutamine-hydrolysing)